MNIVDLIHQEFDTAVDKLVDISNNLRKQEEAIIVPEADEAIENGNFLADIGFSNVQIASKAVSFKKTAGQIADEKKDLQRRRKHISIDVERYTRLFPFHKFITYSQVIQILEKYNLYLGHSSLYKGDIPKKNISDMKEFMEYVKSAIGQGIFADFNSREPLCAYRRRPDSWAKYTFFICAPKDDFISGKGIHTFNKEIFRDDKSSPFDAFEKLKLQRQQRKIEDPIVLMPVVTSLNQIGFIVVTKWGAEAEDPALVVPINN